MNWRLAAEDTILYISAEVRSDGAKLTFKMFVATGSFLVAVKKEVAGPEQALASMYVCLLVALVATCKMVLYHVLILLSLLVHRISRFKKRSYIVKILINQAYLSEKTKQHLNKSIWPKSWAFLLSLWQLLSFRSI